MTSTDLETIVSAINLVGLPLIVIWAAHKGYLVTGREMQSLGQQYDRLQARYEALEERMAAEQAALRTELEGTRSQLIELLMREHRQGASRETL
jgi:hypothetical protein